MKKRNITSEHSIMSGDMTEQEAMKKFARMSKTGKLSQSSDGRYLVFGGGGVDEYGKPVEKTQHEYPYSYDGFVTWRGGKNEEVNDTLYTDRLSMWDSAKNKRLLEKHFGDQSDYWDRREPKKIEAFLRDWYDCPKLKLIFIMQYCNVSSGYPCWRFDLNTNK